MVKPDFLKDNITWENSLQNTSHFLPCPHFNGLQYALYASMQILEECNSLCLLPNFNKICWLSLTNYFTVYYFITLVQIFIFYMAFLQGGQDCFNDMHFWSEER